MHRLPWTLHSRGSDLIFSVVDQILPSPISYNAVWCERFGMVEWIKVMFLQMYSRAYKQVSCSASAALLATLFFAAQCSMYTIQWFLKHSLQQRVCVILSWGDEITLVVYIRGQDKSWGRLDKPSKRFIKLCIHHIVDCQGLARIRFTRNWIKRRRIIGLQASCISLSLDQSYTPTHCMAMCIAVKRGAEPEHKYLTKSILTNITNISAKGMLSCTLSHVIAQSADPLALGWSRWNIIMNHYNDKAMIIALLCLHYSANRFSFVWLHYCSSSWRSAKPLAIAQSQNWYVHI